MASKKQLPHFSDREVKDLGAEMAIWGERDRQRNIEALITWKGERTGERVTTSTSDPVAAKHMIKRGILPGYRQGKFGGGNGKITAEDVKRVQQDLKSRKSHPGKKKRRHRNMIPPQVLAMAKGNA